MEEEGGGWERYNVPPPKYSLMPLPWQRRGGGLQQGRLLKGYRETHMDTLHPYYTSRYAGHGGPKGTAYAGEYPVPEPLPREIFFACWPFLLARGGAAHRRR